MGSPSAPNDRRRTEPPRGGGHRVPRQRGGQPMRSKNATVRVSPPDLGAIARDAVISFLREASAAPAGDGGSAAGPGPDGPAPGPRPTPGDGLTAGAVGEPVAAGMSPDAAQAVAVRAAAVSVATLDRIESAAARLEADIAAARQEQAELQRKAGAAAEAAVRAAEEALTSAGTAQEASAQAKTSMRVIGAWGIAIAVLVVIQLLILVLFAATTH